MRTVYPTGPAAAFALLLGAVVVMDSCQSGPFRAELPRVRDSLSEKLDPLQAYVPAGPTATQPVRGRATLAPRAEPQYALPPVGAVAGGPRIVREGGLPWGTGPVALDLPTLPVTLAVALPAHPLLPAGLPLRMRTEDAGLAGIPMFQTRPPGPVLDPTADPTAEGSQRSILLATPAPRTAAAPFLRLAIPDPYEERNAVRLTPPPVDAAPPERATDLPPKPALPVK